MTKSRKARTMETLQEKEFKNRRGDEVKVILMHDSFNGFHLIVKSKRLRKEQETRFHPGNNGMVKLEKISYLEETTHTYTDNDVLARIEFQCELFWNALADYTNEKLQEDITAIREGKEV
jgi:hypothetical protein